MNTIPTTSDAITGICRLIAVPLPAVQFVSRNEDGTGRIYLHSDSQVINIPVINQQTFHFTETSSTEEGGKVYNQNVKGVIQQESAKNRALIKTLEDGKWVVIFQQCDDKVRCVGSSDFPLSFHVERDSNKPYVAFEFVGISIYESLIVDEMW